MNQDGNWKEIYGDCFHKGTILSNDWSEQKSLTRFRPRRTSPSNLPAHKPPERYLWIYNARKISKLLSKKVATSLSCLIGTIYREPLLNTSTPGSLGSKYMSNEKEFGKNNVPPIILLQNGVLCAQIQRPLLFVCHRQRCFSKGPNRLPQATIIV